MSTNEGGKLCFPPLFFFPCYSFSPNLTLRVGYIYSTAAETRASNVWDLIIPGGRWGSRWKGWSCFVYCTVYSWPQLESLNEGNWKRGRSSEFIYVDGWMDGKAPLSLVRCPLNEDAAADASNYYDIYECIRGWATARVCGMPRVYHWPPKSSQLASAQWAASLFSSRTVNNRNGLHTCSLSLSWSSHSQSKSGICHLMLPLLVISMGKCAQKGRIRMSSSSTCVHTGEHGKRGG